MYPVFKSLLLLFFLKYLGFITLAQFENYLIYSTRVLFNRIPLAQYKTSAAPMVKHHKLRHFD